MPITNPIPGVLKGIGTTSGRAIDRIGAGLDRAISIFSPAAGLKRSYARNVLTNVRGYDASKTNRFTSGKVVSDGNANEELLTNGAIKNIRKYTREACRNSGIAKSAKRALQAYLCGKGFNLQAAVVDKDGNSLSDLNDQIERRWDIFCQKNNIDVRGKKSFDDFCRQGVGQLFDGGEHIWHFVKNPDSEFLQLESVEADRLDEAYNNYSGTNPIVGGIESSKYGKPVKYHFGQSGQTIFSYSDPSKFVPIAADEIIHTFIEERPGQVRGEPWLAPCLGFLQTIHRAVEAELYSIEIQACLSVVYSSGTGGTNRFHGAENASGSGATSEYESSGNRIRKIGIGTVFEIPNADSIQVVDPKRPGNTFIPFAKFVMQLIAATLEISYEKIAKDYSGGNFSSQRFGDQDDNRHIESLQKWFINNSVMEVYRKFVWWEIMQGRIIVPKNIGNVENMYLASFTAQPREYIDPLKDASADRVRLQNSMLSFKDYYTARGKDWLEEFKQKAKEHETASELGIALDSLMDIQTQTQLSNEVKE